MNVKVENVDKNVRSVEFSIGWDLFKKKTTEVYRSQVGNYPVQGFRKGKAPQKIIESAYGKGIFYDKALNSLLTEEYIKAIKEAELDVVSSPEFDIKEFEEGNNIVISVKVTVKPEVILGQYTDLGIVKDPVVVTEDDIEEALNEKREKNARLIKVDDRPVEDGDTVLIDYCGTIDGVEFEGGTAQNYSLVIGSGTFIPGFEEQIIGKEIGVDFEVKVTFPEKYNKKLAGKDAVFACKINEISMKNLPEADDEFAQEISEVDTLDELKNEIRMELTEKKNTEANNKYLFDVMDKVVENSEIDLPECMIENRIEFSIRQFEETLKYQGMDLKTYLTYMGKSIDEFKEMHHDGVEKDLLRELCLEAIVKSEGITATEEECDAKLSEMAEGNGDLTLETIKKTIRDSEITRIKDEIVLDKVFDLLTTV